MTNFLFTLAAFAVTLGVLIVVHEAGHFLIARLCGVKVLRFSIGFGKPLIGWRLGRDRTEWSIGAFPLGGYVKMLDEREGEVASAELSRAFNRQSVIRRMSIVVAGPVANLALAVVLYWGLFVHGVPGLKPIMGKPPSGTPAAAAGFRDGDLLVRIGRQPVTTWQDARWVLLQDSLQATVLTVGVKTTDGEMVVRRLDLRRFSGDATGDIAAALGFTLFQPVLAPVLGALSPQGAAARAGMQPRDRIVAINGQPVRHWGDLVKRVRNGPGKRLVFRLYRGDVLHRVTVVPAAVSAGEGKTIGQIGAAPYVAPDAWRALTATARYGPAQALSRALARTWDTALFSLRMLGRMLTGGVSWKNLSGPLTIADYAGQTAHLGWLPYLSFLALISISLGVLNLLPIPLLDGGHLMYYIVEIFTGKPVSDRAMEIGQQIGMAILLLLMLFAFYNDINRLIAG